MMKINDGLTNQQRWLLRNPLHMKEYYQKHKEIILGKRRVYWREHKEDKSEYNKNYRMEHPNYDREWRQNHLECARERHRKWVLENPNYNKEWVRKHPEKWRSYISKRNRSLGFDVLWQPEIMNSYMVYHHINKIFVVGIPKELHKSVWHNLRDGRGMEEINKLAFEYIIMESN